jgi:glycosyltransferase involved in cell wall biosynthesis
MTAPTFSIVIPARDEERFIGACLESIRIASHAYGGRVETIVALNCCTDRTEEIARSFGARTVSVEDRVLAAVRNAGARVATGDILITIDADSTMHPRTFSDIERRLASGKYIGGGAVIWPERWSLGLVCTAVLLLSCIGWQGISAGLFWLYRRDFEALGGFDETLVSAEDVDFAQRLRDYGRERGKRFATLVRSSIITSCRKFDHFGDWYFVKNFRLIRAILGGKDRAASDHVYYDFPH